LINNNTRYCPHNLKNAKPKGCGICEDATHSTQECHLNGKNKKKYQAIYHIEVTN